MKAWDGKLYEADSGMKEILDELWYMHTEPDFYRAFYEGVKCGRVYEVMVVKP